MNKVINCLVNHNPVITKKLKEVSIEEGRIIATELFQILNKRQDGIGLAANQVGIDAQVAVVNVREPIILINPKIIDQWDEVSYYEGCLSFPNHGIRTERYTNIIVKSADSESNYYLSGAESAKDAKGSWETAKKHDTDQRLLEAICVQHEIDHLMGKTIHDREKKLEPAVSDEKIGRNQIVMLRKDKRYKQMKYKKSQKFINDGWVIDLDKTIKGV
jgi:peptide deformylase